MLQMKPAASGKPGRLRVTCGMLAAGILLLTCLSSFPESFYTIMPPPTLIT